MIRLPGQTSSHRSGAVSPGMAGELSTPGPPRRMQRPPAGLAGPGLGPLPVRPPAGRGRDGASVQGLGPPAPPVGGAQVPAARRARVEDRFLREAQAQASIEHQRLRGVRGGRGGRPVYIAMQFIEGDPRRPRGNARRKRSWSCAGGRSHPRRPPAGDHPPRPEAGQHHAGDGRRRACAPSWSISAWSGKIGQQPHPHPHRHHGHAGLHVARAGPRKDKPGGPADRRLQPRGDPVRGLGRQPAVRGRAPVEILLRVIHDEPVPLRDATPRYRGTSATIVMKCLEKEPATPL